uniref:Secreted protein n=1 Tax=Setaria viridis TaxID=4556 RepID=A0A4U6W3A4_SETVI|nr:hypothetical protein SEVIR_2G346275v2 [Setaria viridis]
MISFATSTVVILMPLAPVSPARRRHWSRHRQQPSPSVCSSCHRSNGEHPCPRPHRVGHGQLQLLPVAAFLRDRLHKVRPHPPRHRHFSSSPSQP